SITFAHAGGLGGVIDDADLAALESKELPVRVCDLYAQCLRPLEGSPVFEACWPETRRDAVINQLVEFLDRWGDSFRLLPTVSFDRFESSFEGPRFHLPKLDPPATSAEVKQASAIFSLQDGKSEVRQ